MLPQHLHHKVSATSIARLRARRCATMAEQIARSKSRRRQLSLTQAQQLLQGGTGKTAATVGVGTATVQRVRAEMGLFESEAAA